MTIAIHRTHRPSILRATVSRAAGALHRWWRWRVERWELLAMNERELRDIGLMHTDVHSLAGKPFWRR